MKYNVDVEITNKPVKKTLKIHASTPDEAGQKAKEVVMAWANVIDCDIGDVYPSDE